MAEIFISEKIKITGSAPPNAHGIGFCPSAFALASAPVTASNLDPVSGVTLMTAALVSSTVVNNFVASVKYGLASVGSTGNATLNSNLFAFNVAPNAVAGIVDNALGIRVDS